MIKIVQSTVERLLYIALLIIFLTSIAIYVKISIDDNKKFRVLKANQDQIFCVIEAPPNLATQPRAAQLQYITNCKKVQ